MIVAALSVGLAAEHGLVRGLLCRGVELREPASHPLALVGELVGIVGDELGDLPRAGDRKHGTRAGQAASTLFLTTCAGVANMTACGVWIRSAA